MVKASGGRRTESESLPLDLHTLVGVATSCGRQRSFPEKRSARNGWKEKARQREREMEQALINGALERELYHESWEWLEERETRRYKMQKQRNRRRDPMLSPNTKSTKEEERDEERRSLLGSPWRPKPSGEGETSVPVTVARCLKPLI